MASLRPYKKCLRRDSIEGISARDDDVDGFSYSDESHFLGDHNDSEYFSE